MKTLKLNFTVPADVAALLKTHVGDRKRSAFVTAAIQEKLNQMEQERMRQLLVEGYLARREEDAQINKEWETPTLEGWQ